MITIYFIFITPIFIVFEDYMVRVRTVEFILDLIYCADIIRKFFTADHGEKDLKKVLKRKLFSPLFLDLVTTIPALVTFESYYT